jgi:hypothetical protein
MLENKSTRGTKKPAAAAKKAAPKVAVKSAPAGGNGEAPARQAEQAAILVESIPALVSILAENIRHNTELLEQIDRRRAQQTQQTGDRLPGIEQLRTILNYKAIGQMTGRRGSAFQGNLVAAHRVVDLDEKLFLLGLPDGTAKVSVQVDGDPSIAEVFPASPGTADLTLNATRGRTIGRIEVLTSQDQPIRLGPRMVAVPSTNIRSSE